MSKKKAPLWQRLVDQGLVADRKEAEGLVLARKVYIGDTPATSPAQPVQEGASLRLRGLTPFAGKGGLKLSPALARFGIEARDRVAIDAGASTGGFTDALLRAGCARVYAVDVGYGQLTGTLRADPRVVNLERTNISDPSLLALDPRPTLGTVDLSYLSLRQGVPAFAAILQGRGDLVCLVKPLFEIDDPVARREGIIPPQAYVPTLRALCGDLAAGGYAVLDIMASPVTGNGGTLEFFLHVGLGPGFQALGEPEREGRIHQAVEEALGLEKYKK